MGGGYKLVRLEQLQSSPQWQWWWETNASHCNDHRTSDLQWLELGWILTIRQRSGLGDNMVGDPVLTRNKLVLGVSCCVHGLECLALRTARPAQAFTDPGLSCEGHATRHHAASSFCILYLYLYFSLLLLSLPLPIGKQPPDPND